MKNTLLWVEGLNKASGICFFFAFVISKFLPFILSIPGIFQFLTIVALLFQLLGCLTWIIACTLHPLQEKRATQWYGFMHYNKQCMLAGYIGLVGILGCLFSLLFSPLLAPSMWVFCVCNLIWCVAEYHKMKNPHAHELQHNPQKQRHYFQYSCLNTTLSFVFAVTTTILVSSFSLVGFTLLVSSTISIVIALAAAAYYLAYFLAATKNTTVPTSSVIPAATKLQASPTLASHHPSLHLHQCLHSRKKAHTASQKKEPVSNASASLRQFSM